jgi:hypothetical protein
MADWVIDDLYDESIQRRKNVAFGYCFIVQAFDNSRRRRATLNLPIFISSYQDALIFNLHRNLPLIIFE